jgi:tetratricopeptide (TPR) repeat protein
MLKPLLCLRVVPNCWRKVTMVTLYAHSLLKSLSGDVEGALSNYSRSVEINRTASGLFNLGVTHYHLSMHSHIFLYARLTEGYQEQFDEAIKCWNDAIELDPTSADAHTSQKFVYL